MLGFIYKKERMNDALQNAIRSGLSVTMQYLNLKSQNMNMLIAIKQSDWCVGGRNSAKLRTVRQCIKI